jgi:putative ABC transport system permease protein
MVKMLKDDVNVGFVSASTSIRRGNKKTTIFIIFVLTLIYLNLVFLPSLTQGLVYTFIVTFRDYDFGDIVVEPMEEKPYINDVSNVLAKIESINRVKGVTKRLGSGGSLQYKQKFVPSARILGIVPSREKTVSKYPDIVNQGEFLGELSRDEIMLGAALAGIGESSEISDTLEGVTVGSIVTVRYINGVEREYKVKGIHGTGTGEIDNKDITALVNYKELESVLNISGEDKASSVLIKTSVGEEAEVKNKITAVGVKEDVSTWMEKIEVSIDQGLQSMRAIDVMSTIIGLIVGSALIFIIIYINTLNRKREIGILKAIGISPGSIIVSYIFISLFYVISGVSLGLVSFLAVALYLRTNPLIFFETLKLSPEINVLLLTQSALAMIFMGIVAGFLPSWFVTRQEILDAIWGK